jgi:hypothetical protein
MGRKNSNRLQKEDGLGEFVLKGKIVHNGFYTYDLVKYIDMWEPVEITCPIHNNFWQKPFNHINRSGQCKLCVHENSSKSQSKGRDNFILESKAIHGDEYIYDKVEYKNNHKKVTLICREHADFDIVPRDHLAGQGCQECSGYKRVDYESVVKRSNDIHNNYYIYPYAEINGVRSEMLIICPKHGEFYQIVRNHLRGSGCRKCFFESRVKTLEDYLDEAKLAHGDRFDYSNTIYINSKEDICIICSSHGEFWQNPMHHRNGHGCPECSGCKPYDNDSFKIAANKVHNGLYEYDKIEYVNNRTPIEIKCKKHGYFPQIPFNHLRGYGCPTCCHKISNGEIEWLNYQNNINILKQYSVKIDGKTYYFDGYDPEKNIVYEYNGDYYHGNPDMYDPNDINQNTDCSFGELYQNTLEKEEKIKSAGYRIISIWESEWKKIKKDLEIK